MSNKLSLSASDRIAALLDDSSFVEVGAYVTARSTDFNIQENDTPKDGVITGYGVINGKLVYVYSQDSSVLGGAIGEMHAKKIANIYNMAMKVGAPVIGLIDCAGLRLQEATDALHAFARLYQKQSIASGVIPQITAILGTCGGGTAVIPALTDITYMTSDNAKLFVNSPNALDGNYAGKLDTASASYVSTNTSLIDCVCDTEEEIFAEIRNLVSILPSNNEDEAYDPDIKDDLNRIIPNLDSLKSDAKAIIQNIADDNVFVEMKNDYEKSMVIGFAKIGGTTVGCVANNAKDSDSLLTTGGACIAAEFVNFCDAFNIPVLTLVDVEGIKRDEANEKFAAKALGKLAFTYSHITVPTVTLITGKAYGTAGVIMNSKALGADLVYAWTGAEMGLMNKDLLAKIEDLPAGDTSSTAYNAGRGFIDDIIAPEETRQRVAAAFEMLYTKTATDYMRKHGTV